jgi:hypothetical protein
VFAGAVREAVLSREDVINKINANFVPVSVRATDLNNPPPNEEGALLRSIRPYCLEQQGMFVLNEDGQVLTAVVLFDSTRAITDYLDFSLAQFREHSQMAEPSNWSARRFAKYPSMAAPSIAAIANRNSASDPEHAAGRACLSGACQIPFSAKPAGLIVNMVARSIEANGHFSADVIHQEHYSQDQLIIPLQLQQYIAALVTGTTGQAVRLPDMLGQILMMHAYLGNMDVQPVSSPMGAHSDIQACEFYAALVPGQRNIYRVYGKTNVCAQGASPHGAGLPGGMVNQVQLSWYGFFKLSDGQMTALSLLATGEQKLQWGALRPKLSSADEEVNELMSGHPIDQQTKICLGFNSERP